MNIINKIGLEAEFFVTSNGELVFPEDHYFGTDEFIILGEFRSDAGKTRHETIGNFYSALCKIREDAKKQKVLIDFSGFKRISTEFKSVIKKRMGVKTISQSSNIYGTDILDYSDDVVDPETGRISYSKISTGLHIHFSRQAVSTHTFEKNTYTDVLSILTNSQIKRIIRDLDKNILPNHQLEEKLKYRQAGFYEMKSWGFEYRSLPMYEEFLKLEVLENLVDHCFNLLEKLEK